jgi:hypothetical protein
MGLNPKKQATGSGARHRGEARPQLLLRRNISLDVFARNCRIIPPDMHATHGSLMSYEKLTATRRGGVKR